MTEIQEDCRRLVNVEPGEKETPVGEKETPLGEKATKLAKKRILLAKKKIIGLIRVAGEQRIRVSAEVLATLMTRILHRLQASCHSTAAVAVTVVPVPQDN